MNKEPKDGIFIDYDSDADVLYLTYGTPRSGFGDSSVDEVTLRYADSDGAPIGATVIGYHALGWDRRKEALSRTIANHLHLDSMVILRFLDRVTDED